MSEIEKNKNNTQEEFTFSDKKEKKVKSKISIIIIVMIAIVVIGMIAFLIYHFVFHKKTPVNYNETVESYGFAKLYDNGTANDTDVVTKSELLKMVIGSTLNTEDVSDLVEIKSFIEDYNEIDPDAKATLHEKLEYPNQIWVEYAKATGVVENNVITKETQGQAATFLDALLYFSKAKRLLLDKALDTKEGINVKNIESFNVGEQLAIHDMISNAMIENKDYNWKENLTKKNLNSLITNFSQKYNTITIGDEKININKEKEPSNASEYPYTLASVKKDIYEIKNYQAKADSYKNAKNTYANIKQFFYEINGLVQNYYQTILNVDSNTIDEAAFIEALQMSALYKENEDLIKDYVKYVKENQIKISGSAQVQFPAIYFDGENNRVRVKIEYKIERANKKENLLYKDLESKNPITYEKDEESIIVDLPITKALTSDTMYVVLVPQKTCIAGKVMGITESLKEVVKNNNTQSNTPQVNEDEEVMEEDSYDEGYLIP